MVNTVLEGFGGVSYTHRLRTQIVRDSRTALQYFANEAKVEVYRENEDIFSGYKWLATLDTRVCDECAKLDGEIRKILDDFDTPPLHYNCRCTIVPIVEGMDITNEPISMDELNEARKEVNGEEGSTQSTEPTKSKTPANNTESAEKPKETSTTKGTSGKSENLDFILNQVDEEYREEVSEDLAKIAPEHAERLRKYAQDMECDLYNASEYKDCYEPAHDGEGNKIHLNIMGSDPCSTALGFKTNTVTFLHESGHWLDFNMIDEGKTLHERLPDLHKKLRRDYLDRVSRLVGEEVRTMEKARDFYFDYGMKKYGKNAICNELWLENGQKDPMKSNVSDILHGLTRMKYGLTYGHPKPGYWKQEYALEEETIAHFFEAMGSGGKRLETIKEFFPEAFKYFSDEVDNFTKEVSK